MLVDCADGAELGRRRLPIPHGVIDERLLPRRRRRLEPDWALQDPDGLRRARSQHAVPALLAETGVDPDDVIGIGIDFTACTMLPTLADGTPLCELAGPAAQPARLGEAVEASRGPARGRPDQRGRRRAGRAVAPRYGGKISSEWFFAKALQILDEAPEIYARADRLIEAADWIVWQLTGGETRNSCTAGYKAMWSKREGFPTHAYFAALDPRLEHVVDEKMSRRIVPLGTRPAG